jgi:hypothetical protein
MELIIGLIALIAFSFLAFWQGKVAVSVVLWPFTAAIAVLVGFLFGDKYPDYFGVGIGVIFFAYAVFCLAHGYQSLIQGHETED